MSLAHHGVLFLDELPEFDRRVLEVLRQPLESGRVTISRAARHADFPARFQLIAAMNPCPCGFLGHASGKCSCSSDSVQRYQNRVSGPLIDRIDMQVEVAPLPHASLASEADGESTASIAARVEQAYNRQLARQGKPNERLSTREIDVHCRLDQQSAQALRMTMLRFHWSARAYYRVLRVARTIADLAGAEVLNFDHVSEAIQYRRGLRDR